MDYIMIPSSLGGFSNAETEIVSAESGTSKYIIRGDLEEKALVDFDSGGYLVQCRQCC